MRQVSFGGPLLVQLKSPLLPCSPFSFPLLLFGVLAAVVSKSADKTLHINTTRCPRRNIFVISFRLGLRAFRAPTVLLPSFLTVSDRRLLAASGFSPSNLNMRNPTMMYH